MDKIKTYRTWMDTVTSSCILFMVIATFFKNRTAIEISSIAVVLSCVLSLVLQKKWGLPNKIERTLPVKIISWITIIFLALILIRLTAGMDLSNIIIGL